MESANVPFPLAWTLPRKEEEPGCSKTWAGRSLCCAHLHRYFLRFICSSSKKSHLWSWFFFPLVLRDQGTGLETSGLDIPWLSCPPGCTGYLSQLSIST